MGSLPLQGSLSRAVMMSGCTITQGAAMICESCGEWMSTDDPCSSCGAPQAFEMRPHTMTYKGESLTIDTEGWWCTQCDEGEVDGAELARVAGLFREFKTSIDGRGE